MSITYCVCVCVCVCSLSYPACNAHTPYLRPVWLYRNFPYDTIFEKKGMFYYIKNVFILFTRFIQNISRSKET